MSSIRSLPKQLFYYFESLVTSTTAKTILVWHKAMTEDGDYLPDNLCGAQSRDRDGDHSSHNNMLAQSLNRR
jgi:hypothetical protein